MLSWTSLTLFKTTIKHEVGSALICVKMTAWALSLQRQEEGQCRWGAVGRIHSERMKRNTNHCMWHSNKGPRLHSTSVCLCKLPMCPNYICNVFFSGLKGFCCAALRGSPVLTILWNHLQTLHLMGQSSGLTDPWSTRQMFSILQPAADYYPHPIWVICHTQLNLSETGPPPWCFFSCWGPHVSHWYLPPLQGPSSSLSAGMILLEIIKIPPKKTLRSNKHFQQSGRV